MKIAIGLILGFALGYIASVTAAEFAKQYHCESAVWSGGNDIEFTDAMVRFELGICNTGVVIWRNKLYN
jgi:hypothetical protein